MHGLPGRHLGVRRGLCFDSRAVGKGIASPRRSWPQAESKKKCQLFQEEISFLGHIVSARGIEVDPSSSSR